MDRDLRWREHALCVGNAILCVLQISIVNLKADGVATISHGSERSRSGSEKWIKHCVSDEAKHSDESFCQLKWIGCWMFAGRRAADAGPNLLKPLLVIRIAYHAENSCGKGWAPVTAGLSLHQYEFNVIFDHGV